MHMTHSNNAAANRSERDLEALASVGRRLRDAVDLDRQLSLPPQLAPEAGPARRPGEPFTVEDLRLASSLADLASVAVEKAFLYARLRERESRVARLLEAAMNAQETERRRIADEMHDGFLQGLTGLFRQAEIAKTTLSRTAPPEAVAAVQQIQDAIRRASAELRESLFK